MPAILQGISRTLDVKVSFQWDGESWTDETGNLLKISGALETLPFNEAFQVGRQLIQQMSVTLANNGQRYSIYNTSSPIYSLISDAKTYRRKCKIEMQEDGGSWEPFFVGFIKLPKETVHSAQVTFTVWDAGEFLRQRRSTQIYLDLAEHELVCLYLQLAGLVDGADFISPTYAAANDVTATIDYSSTTVPYSWLDDEQIWDELVDVAQASGARIYINRDGMVYFEKAHHWATPYTPAIEIAVSDYAELEPTYDDKTFYDEVLVGYAPRVPGDDAIELWRLTRSKMILAGKTETIEARLRYPALSVNPPVVNTDYYLRSLTGADLSGDCTVALTYYAQQVKIVVTNSSSRTVSLGNFVLKGRPLIGQPSEQVRREIDSPEHSRRLEVRDNPYLMSEGQATSVADTLKWWCEVPKLVVNTGKMRGIPTLRLGQAATVTGPNLALDGIITRISSTLTVEGIDKIKFVQDLTLLQNVFASTNGYFIIGVDHLGDTREVWI